MLHELLKSTVLRLLPPVRRLHAERDQLWATLETERRIHRATLETERRIHRCTHRLWSDRGTAEQQARVIRLFRLFSPVTVLAAPMMRIGRRGDGGYVMLNRFAATRAAFSFGIGDEISWDCDIARLHNIPVYQYDDSVDAPPVSDPHFVFHKKMIGPQPNATCESIASVLQKHGAPGDGNILKMDIEGAEWKTFDAASNDDLARFSQIACEFHGFDRIGEEAWYQRALRVMIKLRSLFEVIHVHANTSGQLALFASVPFPRLLEVTFIAKSGYAFAPSSKIFPTEFATPRLLAHDLRCR